MFISTSSSPRALTRQPVIASHRPVEMVPGAPKIASIEWPTLNVTQHFVQAATGVLICRYRNTWQIQTWKDLWPRTKAGGWEREPPYRLGSSLWNMSEKLSVTESSNDACYKNTSTTRIITAYISTEAWSLMDIAWGASVGLSIIAVSQIVKCKNGRSTEYIACHCSL